MRRKIWEFAQGAGYWIRDERRRISEGMRSFGLWTREMFEGVMEWGLNVLPGYMLGVGFVLIFFGIAVQVGIWWGMGLERNKIILEIAAEQIIDNSKRIDALEKQMQENREHYAPGVIKRRMIVTGYCNHPVCINDPRWQDGMTATGTKARVGVCAADWDVLPVGTKLFVPGYGGCTVEDKGGKVRGGHIDLFFETYKEAKEWGKQILEVELVG